MKGGGNAEGGEGPGLFLAGKATGGAEFTLVVGMKLEEALGR